MSESGGGVSTVERSGGRSELGKRGRGGGKQALQRGTLNQSSDGGLEVEVKMERSGRRKFKLGGGLDAGFLNPISVLVDDVLDLW